MDDDHPGDRGLAVGFQQCAVETWQEEMARWKRDPESLKRHKEDIAEVGKILRDHGVDLPIVLPNPHFPVGDQIGREARIHTGDYLYPVRFGEKFD